MRIGDYVNLVGGIMGLVGMVGRLAVSGGEPSDMELAKGIFSFLWALGFLGICANALQSALTAEHEANPIRSD